MPQWGKNDASSNTVKWSSSLIQVGSGKTARAANTAAMFGNTSPGAFVSGKVTGVFAVSQAEKANTTGEGQYSQHAGWNLRTSGTGPVSAFDISDGGTGYSNNDLIKVSGGQVNAAATLVTNSTGGIVNVVPTNYGSGFTNVSSTTVAVTNSSGGAANGTGATITATLGGRAGRVSYETLVAFGGDVTGDASDDNQLPEA